MENINFTRNHKRLADLFKWLLHALYGSRYWWEQGEPNFEHLKDYQRQVRKHLESMDFTPYTKLLSNEGIIEFAKHVIINNKKWFSHNRYDNFYGDKCFTKDFCGYASLWSRRTSNKTRILPLMKLEEIFKTHPSELVQKQQLLEEHIYSYKLGDGKWLSKEIINFILN